MVQHAKCLATWAVMDIAGPAQRPENAVEESRRRAERARQAALFRYQLIQDVVDPGLSARQRGAVVRELADRVHDGPGGARVTVSEQTIRPSSPAASRRRPGSATWT